MFNQLRKLVSSLAISSITTNKKMLALEISLTLSAKSLICNIKLMMEKFRSLINMKLIRDPRLNTKDLLIKINKEQSI